jgi:cytochrome b561
MRAFNSSKDYGAIAMTLHWAVVVLVLGSWLSGQFGDELPRGAPRDTGLFVHISLGIAIVCFVLARLFWRLADPPPAPEQTPLGIWGERAAKIVQFAIYGLLIAVPAVGVLAQFARGHGLPVFGLFEIASPWTADRNFAKAVTEVHEMIANTMMALIGVHAAAAIAHHYILRDRTLRRMLPGSRA